MEKEKIVYVIPEITPLATSGKTSLVEETKGKIPKLKDVLIKLRKDLDEVGITEWEATIETHLTLDATVAEAGIKTTLKISGKP